MMIKLYTYGVFAFFLLLALALLFTIAPAAQSPAFPFIPEPMERPVAIAAVGDPLPRIQCPAGYTATVYAEGLSSPELSERSERIADLERRFRELEGED